jgi:hypothetical protein
LCRWQALVARRSAPIFSDWYLMMELDPVFLSRAQFAFLISFHIIFPSFTIGLAAWLATIEGVRLAIGKALYRRVSSTSGSRASTPQRRATPLRRNQLAVAMQGEWE